MSRRMDVVCDIDIEQSFDSFHAHAIPDSSINPGDVVIVHGAPENIAFGESFTGTCNATLIRASWPRRLLTQCAGLFALAELYEVGFQPTEMKG